MAGGKSRKSGGVSRDLINRLKQGGTRALGDKKPCGSGSKKKKAEGDGFGFDISGNTKK